MSDARDRLIDFLDERAFDPVLEARPSGLDEPERRMLDDVKSRVRGEKARYHDLFGTASEVRTHFLRDAREQSEGVVGRELSRLRLPRLAELKDEFLRLCDDLGVAA